MLRFYDILREEFRHDAFCFLHFAVRRTAACQLECHRKSGKRQAVLGDQRQRNRCDYGADLFTLCAATLCRQPAVFGCLNRITGGLYRPGR